MINTITITAGGVAPIPLVLQKTADFLRGKPVEANTILSAIEIVNSEISPITDARGTKEYKRLLLRQLIFAHFITLFPNQIRMEVLLG